MPARTSTAEQIGVCHFILLGFAAELFAVHFSSSGSCQTTAWPVCLVT